MSEHGGVGYMNETAADVACYQSVKECQLMILIIGKRYGSKTQGSGLVSVTEHEYDTCMEHKPRLITFADGEVLNYKRVFDGSPNAANVNYPGMDNANATFAFINKVMHAPVRNAIIPFSSVSDVRLQLKQQLATLFHDLLDEHANPVLFSMIDYFTMWNENGIEYMKLRPSGLMYYGWYNTAGLPIMIDYKVFFHYGLMTTESLEHHLAWNI
jgi:hypothetical protein